MTVVCVYMCENISKNHNQEDGKCDFVNSTEFYEIIDYSTFHNEFGKLINYQVLFYQDDVL